jgi:DNA-binding response OmpR family regulator
MRIFIVEDDPVLADGLTRSLRAADYAVDCVEDGAEADHVLNAQSYDLVILDLGLPKLDGFEVLRRLRRRGSRVPVLVLTARDALEDRVKGLDLGADDYLAKPFSLDELRARVRALLRRGSESGTSTLKLADVTMDLLRREIRRGGEEIRLTPREYALLEYLMRHPNRVLTRTSIAEHVWDYSFDWQSNVVDVFVNYLRRKLEGDGRPKLIHTIRGVGYMIREPEPGEGS